MHDQLLHDFCETSSKWPLISQLLPAIAAENQRQADRSYA
jgi:hypothetical protein